MMKMMILAPRRPGMTHPEFRRYLLEVHGPLVCATEPVARGIRHYHYNFPLPGQPDPVFGHPVAAELDVVTEGWFDSVAAQERNMAVPEYMAIVRPDEGRFADEGRALMHRTHEIGIGDGTVTVRKLFYFRRRRAGLDRDQFQSRWRAGMTEIVGESSVWPQVIAGYRQNHALSEPLHPHGEDPRYFDVIDELCLRDGADPAALAADEPLMGAIGELEQTLTEPGRNRAFVAETVVNIA